MLQRARARALFIAPGIVWVLLLTVFPLLYSLRLSFFNARLGPVQRFVGLANFARLLRDYRFWNALSASTFFVLASVTLTVLLGLGAAFLFSRPLFAAPIALGWLGITIFGETTGPINVALRGLGVTDPPGWFHDVWAARAAIVLVDVWQWTPFCFLVLLAALEALPREIYESARLETTSSWSIFRRITLPLLAPALLTVTLLRLVEAFKMFDIPFSMTSGGPGSATLTYSLLVYQIGLRDFNQGYASALAWVLLLIMLAISAVFFARLRAAYAGEVQ